MLCQSLHDVHLHDPHPQVSWWGLQLLWASGMDRTCSARILVPTDPSVHCPLVRHQGTQLNGSTQQMPCSFTVCSRPLRYSRNWPMCYMGLDHNFLRGSCYLCRGGILPEVLSQRHQSQRNTDVRRFCRLNFDRTMRMWCNSGKLTHHHRNNWSLKSRDYPTSSKYPYSTTKLKTS